MVMNIMLEQMHKHGKLLETRIKSLLGHITLHMGIVGRGWIEFDFHNDVGE